MTCAEIIEKLDMLAPRSLAMDWDNPGLLAGDPDEEVRRVYLALDAGSAAVEDAVRRDCQMLITHHPLIFTSLKAVRTDDFIGRRLIRMIRSNISCYAMHTNFDIAVMGHLCMEKLGIPCERPLELTCQDPLMGIGAVGNLSQPLTLSALAHQVRDTFGLPPVRVFGGLDTMITRVAICPGSGKGMDREAILSGAQVLITGDVDHHFGIDSVERGLSVIDAGHHGMEHVFVSYMKDWFAREIPEIEVAVDENLSPFTVF